MGLLPPRALTTRVAWPCAQEGSHSTAALRVISWRNSQHLWEPKLLWALRGLGCFEPGTGASLSRRPSLCFPHPGHLGATTTYWCPEVTCPPSPSSKQQQPEGTVESDVSSRAFSAQNTLATDRTALRKKAPQS